MKKRFPSRSPFLREISKNPWGCRKSTVMSSLRDFLSPLLLRYRYSRVRKKSQSVRRNVKMYVVLCSYCAVAAASFFPFSNDDHPIIIIHIQVMLSVCCVRVFRKKSNFPRITRKKRDWERYRLKEREERDGIMFGLFAMDRLGFFDCQPWWGERMTDISFFRQNAKREDNHLFLIHIETDVWGERWHFLPSSFRHLMRISNLISLSQVRPGPAPALEKRVSKFNCD